MSLCTRNRWTAGTGSSSYASKNQNQDKEAKSNEMEDKFKKMMADRAKQDNIWTQPSFEQTKSSESANAKKELK